MEKDRYEREVTDLFQLLRHLEVKAMSSHLLCKRDVEALRTLARLNQVQQQADQLQPGDESRQHVDMQFSVIYNWLTRKYHYPIHKDETIHLWRIGTWEGRKDT